MFCHLLVRASLAVFLLSVVLVSVYCVEENSTRSLFRVASWNILASFMERKEDGDCRKWNSGRSTVVDKTIQAYDPDILCLQELAHDQIQHFADMADKWDSYFLGQHPSDIPLGISPGSATHDWTPDKRLGTPVPAILVRRGMFNILETGAFWLKDDPSSPSATDKADRGCDRGFGNTRTYRAVMWVKLVHLKTPRSPIWVFNSHYPLDGKHVTRQLCAQLERKQIEFLTQGDMWISLGDRNLIHDVGESRDSSNIADLQPLIEGAHNAVDAIVVEGPKTTFAGFPSDNTINPVMPNGLSFQYPWVLDVIVGKRPALLSGTILPVYDPATFEVQFNPEVLPTDHNDLFIGSDHLFLYADYEISTA